MDKILIKLYLPMIEQQYDILIPKKKKIYGLVKLIAKAVYELSDGYYNPSKIPSLYDKLSGRKFDYNLSIKDTDIKNGTEIVMI